MSLLGAASLVSGGVNLAKGLFGAVQSVKANRGINRLLKNPVTWKTPDEYYQNLQSAQQRANQSNPAWMNQAKDNIGGAFATGVGNLKESAISSNTLNRGIGDLYSKQIEAYQNLGMEAQKWQDTQRENLDRVRQRGEGYSMDKLQFDQNNWDVQMNQLRGDKQAGATNLFGGIEGMAGNLMSFAGTDYYKKILEGLRGQGGNGFSAIASTDKWG